MATKLRTRVDTSQQIEREKDFLPDFEDVNKYYAFECGDMGITAGYVLHGLRKEATKGGPHQNRHVVSFK